MRLNSQEQAKGPGFLPARPSTTGSPWLLPWS